MQVRSIFSSLEGTWDFTRTISLSAFAQGTACFQRQKPDEFLYRENGTITTAEKTTHVFWKEYLYKLLNGQIQVFFQENPLRIFRCQNLFSSLRNYESTKKLPN